MERIQTYDKLRGRYVWEGVLINGVFVQRKLGRVQDNMLRMDNALHTILRQKGCSVVQIPVKHNGDRVYLESEMEDWYLHAAVKGSARFLPDKYVREAVSTPETPGRKNSVSMDIIDMHDPAETRFCARCRDIVGESPQLSCKSGRFLAGKTHVPTRRKVSIYIVGEAPGADEVLDPEGRFFVGRAGAELVRWLTEAGIDLKEVYVDNVVRCALPSDMSKLPAQQQKKLRDNCVVYLQQEIARLKPRVIVALGSTALQTLLGVSSITRWLGRRVIYTPANCYLVPVMHPAAILRGQIEYRARCIDALRYAHELSRKPVAKSVRPSWRFILTDKEFDACMCELEATPAVVVDLETRGLDVYAQDAVILGIAVACSSKKGWFIPLWQFAAQNRDADENSTVHWDFEHPRWSKAQRMRIAKLLRSRRITKIFHNAAFDMRWLMHNGIEVSSNIYDTLIANSVLDDIDNGLKDLAWLYTDFGGYEAELEAAKKAGKVNRDYSKIDPYVLAQYASYDAVATYCIYTRQQRELAKHPAQELIYELMRLRYNLTRVELTGCRIDLSYTQKLKDQYNAEKQSIAAELAALLKIKPGDINLNSPPQLVDILFERPGALFAEFNVEHSTDKRVLGDITRLIKRKKSTTVKGQRQLRAIELLLEWRRLDKFITTFLEMFLERSIDAKVHPNFTVHITRTGRLSSQDPNLQNIPRKGGIRDCFVADDDDSELLEGDYSQLELRIAAEYSQDKRMLEILNDPEGDIHSQVGVASFRKPDGSTHDIEHFMAGEPRARAKIISFSTIYGKTPVGLSYDLDCSVEDACKIFNLFFEGFPGLREFRDRQHAFVERYGYVETLFGRRLYIPGAQSSRQEDIEAAHRRSVNYPVQSAASDVVIYALNRVYNRILKERWHASLLLTVHDSMLFSVKKSEISDFAVMLRSEMERSVPQIQHVKLYASFKQGARWGSMREIPRG